MVSKNFITNTMDRIATKPKENPDNPEPEKKELPVKPREPEITPNPKERPFTRPEEPQRMPPDFPSQPAL
jgi:hypothetical protein